MARAKDIAGQVFGRLTALRPTAERRSGSVVWECSCACGTALFMAAGIALRAGRIGSCGCDAGGWDARATCRRCGAKNRSLCEGGTKAAPFRVNIGPSGLCARCATLLRPVP